MADGYKDFIAGTVGGFSGKLLDYPFDTVKVLLQTQNSLSTAPTTSSGNSAATNLAANPIANSPLNSTIQTTKANAIKYTSIPKSLQPPPPSVLAKPKLNPPQPVYRGAIHCLSHQIKTRGFRSLYKGMSSPLLGSMAENAVLFLAYAEIKRTMGEVPGQKELSLLELSLAGGVAGFIVSWVLNPFEVIKVQMQVMNSEAAAASGKGKREYKGLIDCVSQTIRNEGISRGLYRGQTSLLMREVPGNFCWYGVYEGVCLSQIPDGGSKRDLGLSTHLLGGAAAGVAYWTAFYPADTVGSQIRANPEYASRKFMDVLLEIYKKEGWRGLYRGWGITAMRAAPAHALIFGMYEQTMGQFRKWDPEVPVEDCIDKRSGSLSHSS